MSAFLPAFFLAALLAMSGCSMLGAKKDDGAKSSDDSQVASAAGDQKGDRSRDAFSVDVKATEKIKEYLEASLEIQRYRKLGDVGPSELSRLMVAAEPNARELLGTLGYFTPTITLELKETPDAKTAPREVLITVEPGPVTQVENVAIDFTGAITTNAASAGQRTSIKDDWSLKPGQDFTQSGWDGAKNGGLRRLKAKRYPTGRIETSKAKVDADRRKADLSVTYESGPAYRFGPLSIRGGERYDEAGLTRLARLPVGEDYDQDKLLAAQQRLASSGYYDSVFLTLDTKDTDPQAVPVIAEVREAKLQKVKFGVGFTTDSGPRVSVEHTDNKIPVLGWRAVTKLSIDGKDKGLDTEWTGLPGVDGWRWFGSGALKREELADLDVDSGRLRYGRTKSSDNIDRSVFLQYDYARNKFNGDFVDDEPPPPASTVSANWSWIGRYFDNPLNPKRGQGLAAEIGLGYALLGEKSPYLRTQLRYLGFVPLDTVETPDKSTSRRSRLQVRAEVGAVFAKSTARIPATQLYVTGGDTTVRGYGYREIGTIAPNGATVPGRYLGVASAEYQRPIVYNGKMTDFEGVAFVDAGAVADRVKDLDWKVGVGFGARWNSPIGLVQSDLAYGVNARKIRLHLRLGFTF